MSDNNGSEQALRESGAQRIFSGRKLSQIAFPLGGIGTGSISLAGTGALVDWEIFNRPNCGSVMPYTFFTLWAAAKGHAPVTKVVQSPPLPPFTGRGAGFGFGVSHEAASGLPRLRSGVFHGEYPLAWIEFADPAMPVQVTMEAYNPLIPLNDRDSSLPAALFHFRLHNPGSRTVRVALAANLYNAIGYPGEGPFRCPSVGGSKNSFINGERVRGIFMTTSRYPPEAPLYGSLALSTTWNTIDHQTCWLRSGWFDTLHKFWDEFSSTGTLQERVYDDPSPAGRGDVGSIVLKAELAPGESATLPVYITWHLPNFVKYWGHCDDGECRRAMWKNYYATFFDDAWQVAEYIAANAARLDAETRLFHDTLFATTVPPYVLDAISSQMSTLKTTTCLRLEDGTFYGFEGCHCTAGCCEGSCTHVWNYAQTLAFLFPALERSMRTADYTYNLDEDGRMGFRLQLPPGSPPQQFHAAADGQMGGLLKLYRDWKLCGDDAWLRRLWPRAKKALAYAWIAWDQDRDGVMEGVQHNTFDIEFWGPNTMVGSLYLGALRAAEEIARYLGEDSFADECHALYESGRARMDAELFNGEFYVQKVNPDAYKTSPRGLDESIGGQVPGAPKYQYGDGCLSDQLLGQFLANIAGLGYLFAPDHVRAALKAVFKYNWRTSFWDHPNPQRVYALNDEQGLLVCSWPKGGRPEFPLVYADEVWCGCEYEVAAQLIHEGYVEEGLRIVKGTRDRHDGERRNPWNEFECGSHYARSMASWGVLLALCGYEFDMTRGRIGFAPRLSADDMRTFWSLDSAWGSYAQRLSDEGARCELTVAYGELSLRELHLGSIERVRSATVSVDDEPVTATFAAEETGWTVILGEALLLKPGQKLTIEITI